MIPIRAVAPLFISCSFCGQKTYSTAMQIPVFDDDPGKFLCGACAENENAAERMEKKNHRDWVASLQSSRELSEVWPDKLRELADLSREEKDFLEKRRQELALNAHPPWYLIWSISMSEERVRAYARQRRRFNFFSDLSRGRITCLSARLTPADVRHVPLAEIFAQKPVYSTAVRASYLCPFHKEKTASLVWYKKNNSWYCFGCGLGGDVIGFCQRLYSLSFPGALEYLKRFV